MRINDLEFKSDYKKIMAFSVSSLLESDDYISGKNLLYGIFRYIEQKDYKDLFWNFFGLDRSLLKKRFDEKLDSSLSGDMKVKAKLDKSFRESLQKIISLQDSNSVDAVVMLYVAIDGLSQSFVSYLNRNNIQITDVKNNINGFVAKRALKKVGYDNFFTKLYEMKQKLGVNLEDIDIKIGELDDDLNNISDIKGFEDIEDIDNFESGVGHNVASGDGKGQGDSKIKSGKKDKEKKLTVEYFGTNLTDEAKNDYLDPVIGRDKEIKQLMYTLMRKTKNNPLLVGKAGVGKTAIVEGFAQRVVQGQVPDKLKDKNIFMLNMGSLLAGTKYRGEFEARLKSILEEAKDPSNDIILFIDELHTIIGAGNKEGSADAANMLKPLLSRGKIQVIGATTFDEYQKHIEKDGALKRRFQKLNVNEPNREDSIKIMQGLKDKFEDFHGVTIQDDSIKGAIDTSIRYMLNRQLPDKAIDIIDEACARKSTLANKLKDNKEYKDIKDKIKKLDEDIQKAIDSQDYFKAADCKQRQQELKDKLKSIKGKVNMPKKMRPKVKYEDVAKVIADQKGIPISKLTKSEVQKLKKLPNKLEEKLLGQSEIVTKVVDTIRRNRLSVIDRNKPIGSFVFLGPSGVGKTYLAKLLATEFFGNPKSLIRLDMSEYMEKNSSSKLIGSSPGYVGYDEGGDLTEQVRQQPYSVVLFDEIEKASSEVLNMLLQILDEGQLKDNKGRMVDFKNTIIIMTSNIGSEYFNRKSGSIGFATADGETQADKAFDSKKEKVLEKLKDYMKPELLNRLDYKLVFNPLRKSVLADIFKIKYDEFVSSWEAKDVDIPEYDGDDINKIIDEVYDPEYGARPVEKYIYNTIEPKIIKQLMEE